MLYIRTCVIKRLCMSAVKKKLIDFFSLSKLLEIINTIPIITSHTSDGIVNIFKKKLFIKLLFPYTELTNRLLCTSKCFSLFFTKQKTSLTIIKLR